MRNQAISISVILLLLSAHSAVGQAPPTTDAYLLHKGIQNTPAGLRLALKNADPEVRGVAAQLLAEDGDTGSIPLIREALKVETSEQARRHLAASLSKLKDDEGTAALIQVCGNRDGEVSGRLLTALQLQQLGDPSCFMSVVDIIDREDLDPASRVLGLQYLRHAFVAPASRLDEIRRFLLRSLRDPASGIRTEAATCLTVFGDRGALEALDRVVTAEADESTKKYMSEERDRLKSRLGN